MPSRIFGLWLESAVEWLSWLGYWQRSISGSAGVEGEVEVQVGADEDTPVLASYEGVYRLCEAAVLIALLASLSLSLYLVLDFLLLVPDSMSSLKAKPNDFFGLGQTVGVGVGVPSTAGGGRGGGGSGGKDGDALTANSTSVLEYHESAHSIVFRDYLRRQEKHLREQKLPGPRVQTQSSLSQSDSALAAGYASYAPAIQPFEPLELGPRDVFQPLMAQLDEQLLTATRREQGVVQLLRDEKAVVKTVRDADWTKFLEKFKCREVPASLELEDRDRDRDQGTDCPNSPFRTSTSLLPPLGKKMRCYGGSKEFSVGVVFALPSFHSTQEEDGAASDSDTWAWPSGYSAKTEFNIDGRGKLINGREEALVSVSTLRSNNHSYMNDRDYVVGGRMVHGGLTTVPYNEIFLRVGGCNVPQFEGSNTANEQYLPQNRTFDGGVGPPIALFVRTPTFADLVTLLRTRARTVAVLGKHFFSDIPLLLITPEDGVKILTRPMLAELFRILARNLNPFQNPHLYKTTIANTNNDQMRQKLEELLDLDQGMRTNLTQEECARLAGGFGATDDSVAQLLMDAMHEDQLYLKHSRDCDGHDDVDTSPEKNHHGHKLQDIVNEGLVSAVRAGDYNTARQLLILYTLVATKGSREAAKRGLEDIGSSALTARTNPYDSDTSEGSSMRSMIMLRKNSFDSSVGSGDEDDQESMQRGKHLSQRRCVPPPPPPPPLDTDRLRSATNSDGLLAVLGAAEVLKSIQNGSAKKRLLESAEAVEEWVLNGENSVAYRLQSWRNQRVAQGDLKIAMDSDSHFTAFVGSHAITNRKKFAKQLRHAIANVEVESVSFLQSLHEITTQMHSPCLRLELLQYILGLDNRYSVAHVARSVELAATCLNMSMQELDFESQADGSEC